MDQLREEISQITVCCVRFNATLIFRTVYGPFLSDHDRILVLININIKFTLLNEIIAGVDPKMAEKVYQTALGHYSIAPTGETVTYILQRMKKRILVS